MATNNRLGCIPRVTKDLASLQQSSDLSLAATAQDNDIRYIRALIIGPANTPYEHAFFEFDIKMPNNYPMAPPRVTCMTTNDMKTRFNPNIYSNGKVCLSILGTWPGDSTESWSSDQSLESVLISVQSLMGSNPYQNEPGLEETPLDDPSAAAYVSKVRHESLRIAVIERLEWSLEIPPSLEDGRAMIIAMLEEKDLAEEEAKNKAANASSQEPGKKKLKLKSKDSDEDLSTRIKKNPDLANWDPFSDLVKRRFLWYYDTYVQRIADGITQQDDGVNFEEARFEGPKNTMEGRFQYQKLLFRLNKILGTLYNETAAWIEAGAQAEFAKTPLASQMFSAFTRAKSLASMSSNYSSQLELTLADAANPLHWQITLLGGQMTNLAGGRFHVQFVIPPDFPESWPRVRMLTPIHHRNVTSTGTVCLMPNKPADIQSHINAIVAAIDDEEARYDPRAVVNPAAAAQFWSNSPEQRIAYMRMLKRSAQESVQGT